MRDAAGLGGLDRDVETMRSAMVNDPSTDGQASVGSIMGMYHGGISVANLDRSLAFYRDLLGLELLWQRDASEDYLRLMHGLPFSTVRLAYLSIPGSDTVIELLEYQGVPRHALSYEPSEPATGHVCFFVTGINALDRRLREAGCTARSEGPIEVTAGPNAGSRVVYFEDPDGYPVELLERPLR